MPFCVLRYTGVASVFRPLRRKSAISAYFFLKFCILTYGGFALVTKAGGIGIGQRSIDMETDMTGAPGIGEADVQQMA